MNPIRLIYKTLRYVTKKNWNLFKNSNFLVMKDSDGWREHEEDGEAKYKMLTLTYEGPKL